VFTSEREDLSSGVQSSVAVSLARRSDDSLLDVIVIVDGVGVMMWLLRGCSGGELLEYSGVVYECAVSV
jgi:hypothetical protein